MRTASLIMWRMRRSLGFATLLVAGMLACFPALALDRISARAEQAKALAERAAHYLAEHIKEPEQAFNVFNDPKGPYARNELYVFVIDHQGVIVAHGAQPVMIGRGVRDSQDPKGRLFGRDIMAVQDHGWVEYQWMNPQTQSIGNKKSYIIRVHDYWIGAGIYAP